MVDFLVYGRKILSDREKEPYQYCREKTFFLKFYQKVFIFLVVTLFPGKPASRDRRSDKFGPAGSDKISFLVQWGSRI